MTAFGQRLHYLRKQRKMSQRELAERVGVDFTYISRIEHGRTHAPSTLVICRIAQALEADVDELFNLSGKVPSRLLETALNNPLLTELIRVICYHPISEETYRQLIQIAKESGAKEEVRA